MGAPNDYINQVSLGHGRDPLIHREAHPCGSSQIQNTYEVKEAGAGHPLDCPCGARENGINGVVSKWNEEACDGFPVTNSGFPRRDQILCLNLLEIRLCVSTAYSSRWRPRCFLKRGETIQQNLATTPSGFHKALVSVVNEDPKELHLLTKREVTHVNHRLTPSKHLTMTRSSSKEVRIRVPFFCSLF